jgi:hypothetical protein
MTLCRLRVVQANSHSISITHLVVNVKYLSCTFSGWCVALGLLRRLRIGEFPLVRRLYPTSSAD